MAILDKNGRRINPNRNRIDVGDLGELEVNKEWKKYLYETRNSAVKEKETRKRREAKRKQDEKRAMDRLQYRGY